MSYDLLKINQSGNPWA